MKQNKQIELTKIAEDYQLTSSEYFDGVLIEKKVIGTEELIMSLAAEWLNK